MECGEPSPLCFLRTKSGEGSPHSIRSAISKIVPYVHLVGFEAVDGFDRRRRRNALKPRRRTPTILIGHWNQVMLDRVLMHVIEPRQVRVLIRQPRVPVVIPDGATFGLIEAIQFAGRDGVQSLDQLSEVYRPRQTARDEMIVI